MRPLPKAASVAGIAGVAVFAVVFLFDYLRLLAHQPPHEQGQPWPSDPTSFPPSAAWMFALPCSLIALVGVFIIGFIVFAFQSRANPRAKS